MDINKAIKKQKKSHRNFMLFMCTIFISLPIFLILSNKLQTFFIVYLSILETLIIIAIFIKINNEKLSFQCDGYKFKIKQGIFDEEYSIICDKVFLVHVEDNWVFDIIIISDSKFRNKNFRRVSKEFIKKHNKITGDYERLKRQNPEKDFYYIIIKKGMYYKYELLNLIFKTCVHAFYTEQSIEKIKEYRNNYFLKDD